MSKVWLACSAGEHKLNIKSGHIPLDHSHIRVVAIYNVDVMVLCTRFMYYLVLDKPSVELFSWMPRKKNETSKLSTFFVLF